MYLALSVTELEEGVEEVELQYYPSQAAEATEFLVTCLPCKKCNRL